jgi:hypothetical protein
MGAVDAPLTTTTTPEIKDAEGKGEIILLVEDDEALRESISSYLGLHGYKVLRHRMEPKRRTSRASMQDRFTCS